MADEIVKPVEGEAGAKAAGDAGPAPAFDPEAFRKVIREEVSQFMETTDKDQVVSAHVVGPVATENPLKALIDPLVQPGLAQARLEASSAADVAYFYHAHPEALKYREDLEKARLRCMEQGTPYTMLSLWEFYRGSAKNFDKFVKDGIEAEKVKIAEAEEAATVGGGVRTSKTIKNPYDMTGDELSKAMEGVAF